MDTGLATFLIGMLALVLGAFVLLRNWLAGIFWALAVVALLVAGLAGIGLEMFWLSIAAAVLLLMVGLIVGGGR